MNPTELPDPAVEEQASLWAARLDGGDLTSAQEAELAQWLASHPLHRTLLSQYCQLSADLEAQLPELQGVTEEDPTPASRPAVRRAWWWGAAAGAMAAAAAVVFVLQRTEAPVGPRTLASALAERQEVTLTDGSKVELNAQTSLRIAFTDTERRVRLGSGQAYFAVSKDAQRPFVIETPAGLVRVTGTQFDVRLESADTMDVLVVSGSVQVRPASAPGERAEPIALRPNELLRTRPGLAATVEKLSANDVAEALAWRTGEVVFNGTTLREALQRFARYHGRGLSASAAAGELTIGGRYRLDDLEGFLSSLEDFLPVKVVQHLNGTVEVRLRSE